MLEGATQEGTSDVACSRNQPPPVLEDNQEPLGGNAWRGQSGAQQHQANVLSKTLEPKENSRIPTIPSTRLPPAPLHGADDAGSAKSRSATTFVATRQTHAGTWFGQFTLAKPLNAPGWRR